MMRIRKHANADLRIQNDPLKWIRKSANVDLRIQMAFKKRVCDKEKHHSTLQIIHGVEDLQG